MIVRVEKVPCCRCWRCCCLICRTVRTFIAHYLMSTCLLNHKHQMIIDFRWPYFNVIILLWIFCVCVRKFNHLSFRVEFFFASKIKMALSFAVMLFMYYIYIHELLLIITSLHTGLSTFDALCGTDYNNHFNYPKTCHTVTYIIQ